MAASGKSLRQEWAEIAAALPNATKVEEHLGTTLNEVRRSLERLGRELERDGVERTPAIDAIIQSATEQTEGVREAYRALLRDLAQQKKD